MHDNRLNMMWWTLRIVYGAVPIVAGLDKFTNLLTDWSHYLSPLATRLLPITPTTFMHVVGVIEIGAGLLVLSRLTLSGRLPGGGLAGADRAESDQQRALPGRGGSRSGDGGRRLHAGPPDSGSGKRE